MIIEVRCNCCKQSRHFECSVCMSNFGLKYPSLNGDENSKYAYCPFCATPFEEEVHQEIERKFLVKKMPSYIKYLNIQNIEQRYLKINVEEK